MESLFAALASISFADPWAFLLAPAPLLMLRFAPARRAGAGALRVPGSIGARLGLTSAQANMRGGVLLRRVGPTLIWALLLIAFAGPRTLATAPAAPASARDILIALDLSGSMEREDFSLDGESARRIDAVARLGAAFARRRAGDRLGLIVFAEEAFVASAPSFDLEATATAIEHATIGVAGRSTAISKGLGLALKRLRTSSATSRVVILLSDGINNSGGVDPLGAARLAQRLGIRVHTIALGPALEDGVDRRDAVDAQTLAEIARLSGGTAFRVRTTADLEEVLAAIDELVGSPLSGAPPVVTPQERWIWPAAAAFILAAGLVVARRRSA